MFTEMLKNRKLMPVFAFMSALFWSLAFPFIKLGYAALGIAADDIGSKILFAGLRFTIAGVLVLLIGGREKRRMITKLNGDTWRWLLLFAMVNTVMHYLFSFVGLAFIPSARGSLIDSMGSFMLIILSCIFFADDKMSLMKVIGCLIGFSAIVLINVTPGESFFANISFKGDGFIVINTTAGAFGGCINRVLSKKMDVTAATGMSMAIGGLVMVVIAMLFGLNAPWTLTPEGLLLLLALSLISAVSFSIFNSLLAYHPISQVAIFNAFIPILGVFFASLLLKEPFNIKYIIAGFMVAAGIICVNHKPSARA